MIRPLFYRVTDDSTLLLTSTGTLTVNIQNVNDEDPVFSPSSYSGNVKEQTGGKHPNVLVGSNYKEIVYMPISGM